MSVVVFINSCLAQLFMTNDIYPKEMPLETDSSSKCILY